MAAYDVIVIGGGPGGYVAAIRAAQLGQKTAVVERDKAGGRCLNYACIPAKTVLHTAEIYSDVNGNGTDLGIKANGISIDWKAVQSRRAKVSKTLEDGVEMLWNKDKVEFLRGEASLEGGGKVKVGSDTHEAKAIILATGSIELPIPGVEFSDRVLDTWGAWSLEKLPKAMVVAGAGASGSEIASAYARLGTEVTLVEMLDHLLPLEDVDMARVVERQFKKDGIDVLLGTKVEEVTEQKTGVKVKAGDKELKADYLAIAGGRRPDTDPLNLEAAGVADRGERADQDRRVPADHRRRHLRDRRPRPGAGARPQGLRGGGDRGRARRRSAHPSDRHQPRSRERPSAIPRSPASASPRRRRRRPGARSRSASSSSAAPAPRSSTTTERDW